MKQMTAEIEKELHEHIMPFWLNLIDREHGGFYGLMDVNLNLNRKADKGGIATARHLWAFSSAYRVTGKTAYLEAAKHAYAFLKEKLVDREYGGLYWLVDYQGNPSDDRKHVYCQGFGVYSLSEFARATGDQEALALARELFALMEERGFDEANNAYKEEFTRQWEEKPNVSLSENGVLADITMNTHLHVLEAYTTLYRVWPNERLKERMINLMNLFRDRIYDAEGKYNKVFFNKQWESLLDLKSYGHDIEASWLLDEAIKAANLTDDSYLRMVKELAYAIADTAVLPDGSIANEIHGDQLDDSRVWWVQAEAIVSFVNAYERTQDQRFIELAQGVWDYTKQAIIDHRPGGEWYWSVDADGKPTSRNVADPWKASYHNGRFCLEMIERNAH
ncbi:AGE family epimerase/isomerase [Xylanibacillus composti]|uniref:AGE family epimerase/isomerase n=1 Tax=Xylanibacillus composti TaxID=1572762 RepID=UPI001BCED2F9|nr:AGE family epimerase/isomerase [Xylanibacillus composti]